MSQHKPVHDDTYFRRAEGEGLGDLPTGAVKQIRDACDAFWQRRGMVDPASTRSWLFPGRPPAANVPEPNAAEATPPPAIEPVPAEPPVTLPPTVKPPPTRRQRKRASAQLCAALHQYETRLHQLRAAAVALSEANAKARALRLHLHLPENF